MNANILIVVVLVQVDHKDGGWISEASAESQRCQLRNDNERSLWLRT